MLYEREEAGYELFRHAIVDRDAEAWATIHRRYHPLMVSWAWRYGARPERVEDCTDIADQALARAWVALTPDRLADFPTLRRLLGYLRACVNTTKLDGFRLRAAEGEQLTELHIDAAPTPEQTVLGEQARFALWRLALSLTSGRAERVVLIESFIYAQPPRAIRARYPQLFDDTGAVYAVKRNLLDRLGRNPEMQRLYGDTAGT